MQQIEELFNEFEKKLLDYRCPKCGTEGNPTESGNEVLLTGINF